MGESLKFPICAVDVISRLIKAREVGLIRAVGQLLQRLDIGFFIWAMRNINLSIGCFGKGLMVLFPKVTSYITLMALRTITALRILFASLKRTTVHTPLSILCRRGFGNLR
jgi:hypothetical protein